MILSIIVTAYNLEKYIEECIHSLFFDGGSYEVIVVNDGSIDHTLGILLNLTCNYDQLKVLNQDNEGVGSARNLGLKHATGKYVWFIDGDDVVSTTNFQKAFNILTVGEMDVFAFSFGFLDRKGAEIDWLNLNPTFKNSNTLSGGEFYLNNVRYNYIWQFIIRRSILVQNNLEFITPYKMQDSEFLPRMMYFAQRVKAFDLPLVKYRQRLNSAVNSEDGSDRLFFYESMIVVFNSMDCFKEGINKRSDLYKGLEQKCEDLNQMLYLDFLNNRFNKKDELRLFYRLKSCKLFPFKRIKGFSAIMNLRLNFFRVFINLDPFLFKEVYKVIG